jgi:hypothetical protein
MRKALLFSLLLLSAALSSTGCFWVHHDHEHDHWNHDHWEHDADWHGDDHDHY